MPRSFSGRAQSRKGRIAAATAITAATAIATGGITIVTLGVIGACTWWVTRKS